MKLRRAALLLTVYMIAFVFNLIPVTANQISVIGSATSTTTTQQTVEIPAGDYHVYIETDGYLGLYGVAYCTAVNSTATLFSWSTTIATDTWTGQITFSSSTTITFTFEIQDTSTASYNMNFQIIFTDINVSTITKTSIIGEAPYAVEIIFIAFIAVGLLYAQRRRN